eukprot:scaffold1235_cov300-Pavlova_lutheri.AAC.14
MDSDGVWDAPARRTCRFTGSSWPKHVRRGTDVTWKWWDITIPSLAKTGTSTWDSTSSGSSTGFPSARSRAILWPGSWDRLGSFPCHLRERASFQKRRRRRNENSEERTHTSNAPPDGCDGVVRTAPWALGK